MRERLPILIARVRMLLLFAAIIDLITWPWHRVHWLHVTGLAVFAVVLVSLYLPFGYVRREPMRVRPPVRGRWVPANSPADRVPSHGLHAYGQTYAIDLVYHPATDRAWKGVHAWPPARPPRRFPGFGQPVYAATDGVVVKASGWQRDHWSRNSWPGILFLFVEGSLRELLNPRFVLGNHVVVDQGDGVYAAYAHLRRGSVRVRRGERVAAGQQLAECGNSGNSSEPHLHFQLMDHRNVLLAAGLPFAFDRYEQGGLDRAGVPGARRPFTSMLKV